MREKVELATKFGGVRSVDGNWEIRGDTAYVREACEASLKRLEIDSIDLYYQHIIDTRVPIEITVCNFLHSSKYRVISVMYVAAYVTANICG